MQQYVNDCDYYSESFYDNLDIIEMECVPEGKSFAERNFLWRASLEVMGDSRARLQSAKGYKSTLVILDGSGCIYQSEKHFKDIGVGEIVQIDAGVPTSIKNGKLSYYNLLLREECESETKFVEFTDDWIKVEDDPKETGRYRTVVLYCKSGHAYVSNVKDFVELKEGQLMAMEYYNDESVKFSIKGEGELISTTIYYGEKKADDEVVKKKERIKYPTPTFDDFRLCIYLAHCRKFVTKRLCTKLSDMWQMPDLSKSIKGLLGVKIDAIMFLVLEIFVIKYTAVDNAATMLTWLFTAINFIVSCFVLAPLVFLFKVPRPVKNYLKPSKDLNYDERRLRQREKEEFENDKKNKRIRWI